MQVVHEFAANLLSNKFGVPRATVVDLVRDLLALEVAVLRGEDTNKALQLVGKFGVSFWDALILATAQREGCAVLYSEDFQHSRVYDTVRAINPILGRLLNGRRPRAFGMTKLYWLLSTGSTIPDARSLGRKILCVAAT